MKDLKTLIDKINPDTYLKFKVNKIKQQSPSSNNCGFHAMGFLLDRFAGKEFKDCSGYSNIKESEEKANKFRIYLNKNFTV